MSFKRNNNQSAGFTFIELLITVFIVATVITGIFGLFVLSLRTSQEAQRRVVALALANEKAEMVRNLPYSKVGVVGGIPSGAIVQNETVVRNTVSYTVNTDIRYVDDPYDGMISTAPKDLYNADYKQARIEVSWNSVNKSRPILLITNVAPPGLEGQEAGGTLDFLAINAAGMGIPNATVQLINSAVSPAINFTTQTNSDGRVLLPGLPPSNGSYQISVTKDSFTTEQTYPVTATFIPDTDHARLSMIQSQITPKTFVIDKLSSLSIVTQNDTGASIPSVAYHFQGTKTIGVDQNNQPVYVTNVDDITDVTGADTQANLVWDTYAFTINGQVTGYDIKETDVTLPLAINPGSQTTLTAKLVPHQPFTLHVTVLSPTGVLIENASVQAVGMVGYNQTNTTGVSGQTFFSPLPQSGSYNLTITAPGFEIKQDVITVDGNNRIQEKLTPAT